MPNPNEEAWITRHQLDGELAPIREALNTMAQLHQVTDQQLEVTESTIKLLSSSLLKIMDLLSKTPTTPERKD